MATRHRSQALPHLHPPALALAALDAALDAFEGISIEQIRAKSESHGQLFVDVVRAAGVPHLEVASP